MRDVSCLLGGDRNSVVLFLYSRNNIVCMFVVAFFHHLTAGTSGAGGGDKALTEKLYQRAVEVCSQRRY